MAHVYLAVAECHLHTCGQLQEAEVVGDGGAVLAHTFAELLLRQVVLFDEALVGECHFECREVFALNVLHERHLHHVLVVDSADVGRDGGEADALASPPSAFASDDDVGAVAHVAQGDGLHHAYLPDAVGEFLQAVVVEVAARLVGVGADVVHTHFAEVRGAAGVYLRFCLQQGIESPAQRLSLVFLLDGHLCKS